MSNEWGEIADQIRAMRPRHVLFVCVSNSTRAQMAAAIARALVPASVRISSAGTRPVPIHPLAVEVLADLGVDARDAPSLGLDEIDAADVDVVITLCADDLGATLAGTARRVHWPIPNPAEVGGSELARLEAFRHVRDELMRRLVATFGAPRALAPTPA